MTKIPIYQSFVKGGSNFSGGYGSQYMGLKKSPQDTVSRFMDVPAEDAWRYMGPQNASMQGPGPSGASLNPMMPAGGAANLPQVAGGGGGGGGQQFNPLQGLAAMGGGGNYSANSNWSGINPGVRSRMMGQAYDKQYGVGAYEGT